MNIVSWSAIVAIISLTLVVMTAIIAAACTAVGVGLYTLFLIGTRLLRRRYW